MTWQNWPIVILAGGKATRLGVLAETVPKLLQPLNGEPFAIHQIRQFKRWGLSDLVYCVSHLAEPIIDFLGDGSRFDVRIRYAVDPPVGQARAVERTLGFIGSRFWLIYGDTLVACVSEDLDTMAAWDADAVLTTWDVTEDYGFSLLTPLAVRQWAWFGGPLSPVGRWRQGLEVAVHPMREPYHEIGTPESLAATAEWLRLQEAPCLP